jgi:hypothetical protein
MVNIDHKTDIRSSIVTDRDLYILDTVAGKTLIHLGCVDSGFTMERYENNSLLHMKLANVCNELYGIDIDSDGIDYLQSKGIKDIHCYNVVTNGVENGCEFIREKKIDYIVVGEVLEHLSNPGSFINSISRLAKWYQSKVIFTVPNAFALFRFRKLLKGIEHVHEDHVCYYSPRTVEVALNREHMTVDEMIGYIRVNPTSAPKAAAKKALFQALGNARGHFSDGLIVVASSGH